MVPIEPHQNSFLPFSTSDEDSDADSAQPCDSMVTSSVYNQTQPKYLLTQEQRKALILNKPKVVRSRIFAAAIHMPPKCEPTTATEPVVITPLTIQQAAPRQPSPTKAQLETAKRLREREERKRGRRVQEIHLSVMYGGDRPRSKTVHSTPPTTKPAVAQSPYPETRPQYRERSQRTQQEAAAAAFLTLITAAAVTDFHRQKDAAVASRLAGERQQALTRRRQRFVDAVEQHHRMKTHDGPSSIADSGCSTDAIITPQVARELGLEDLGPSPLTIKDAGGGRTKALHKSRIQVNESTGETGGATVAPIHQSLEGIGKYVDEGNVVVYHPHYNGVTVHRKEDIIINYDRLPIRTGWRDRHDKLWHWSLKAPIPTELDQWLERGLAPTVTPTDMDEHLPEGTIAIANNVYELPSIRAGVRFMHAVCGFPVQSTWLEAIRNNHYVGWPLLSVTNVNKHYPDTVETPRGNLNQSPAGTRSTKPKPKLLPKGSEPDLAKAFNKKEHDVYIEVYEPKDTIHSNQTGKFLVQSRAGHNYIMAMVHVNTNAVLAEPMMSRSAAEMIRAYRALLEKLRRAGFVPKKHILDNECSEELKEVIRDTCKLQLVPPGCHRANLAEVAIKAFKQHFCSILAGLAIDFPRSFWNELLPQTLLTLNLLRKSNATPTVSAHAHLCGQHDYNAQPLLPMGQAAEVHVKRANRKSWDYHSKPAWYLYTSEEHYRTHMFLMKESKTKRLSDTAAMHLRRITDPTLTIGDRVIQSMARLASDIGAFAGKKKNDANMNDLRQLAKIGQRLAEQGINKAAPPVKVTVLPDTSPLHTMNHTPA